jgi:hypothetical protein
MDVSIGTKWIPVLARAINVTEFMLKVYQDMNSVPTEWLAKVDALPDWTPPMAYRRSNFSSVAVELVAALRSAGKSSVWIATTLTAFLRDFNGTKVERADVTNTPPP